MCFSTQSNRTSCKVIRVSEQKNKTAKVANLEAKTRYKQMCTKSAVSTTYNTSYLVRTCRCNCASCCTCHHSTGKGRGPQGQDWPSVDDTSQRTSHFHRKVHQYTSFCKYRAANIHRGYFAPSMLAAILYR